MNGYPKPHRKAGDPLYNDDCLYTSGVIIFKSDISFPERMDEKPYFPAGVVVSYAATGDESIKEKALANAIPEFIRFNIVESEARNVC